MVGEAFLIHGRIAPGEVHHLCAMLITVVVLGRERWQLSILRIPDGSHFKDQVEAKYV